MKYLYKIIKNPDSIKYNLFKVSDVQRNNINEWTVNAKQVSTSIGYLYVWTTQHVTNVNLKCVIQRKYD